VTSLLTRGADVNARAGGGYTPLHIAAFGGDVELITREIRNFMARS